jgi:hypothetical protein
MEELNMEMLDGPVKLFVGQIPRDMDEAFLKSFFLSFGPIVDFSIIRDNATSISKGMTNCTVNIFAVAGVELFSFCTCYRQRVRFYYISARGFCVISSESIT